MRCAFVIYPKMTCLDFTGFYDTLTRLKSMHFMEDFCWQICAQTPWVADDRGLCFKADSINQGFETYDMLFVPGGQGMRDLRYDPSFLAWLKTAGPVPLKISVCTGSVLLAAAGFLTGLKATTHPNAYQELAKYGVDVVEERIVDAGAVITGRGVSSSIDLGLYVVERLADKEVREKIARQMDYPYYPFH